MPRYFLNRLKIEGFRGVNNQGNPLDISFKPNAVNSIFAVNARRRGRLRDRMARSRGRTQGLARESAAFPVLEPVAQ